MYAMTRNAQAGAITTHRLLPIRPRVRIALVGGFQPTRCGIATFTTDVFEQFQQLLPDHDVDVYAMRRDTWQPIAPDVRGVIDQNDLQSYRKAADQMNSDGVDVVWIQHEFGIFGGDCGELVLELFEAVAAPVIVTLHTVLPDPSTKQRAIIERMHAKATRFVVMSASGSDILQRVYGIPSSRIAIVEHGAPDRPHTCRDDGAPPVIMTFGLLGPGKGLESAIRALHCIRAENPEVVYRIVGATHPNLVAIEGERYREGLKQLARDLGVESAIQWVERFLEPDELLDELAQTDIYLTPYPNLAQSTSGTLAYAVALGCAVVSTPYIHARELLADGVGRLVEPNSPAAIADAINELLRNRDVLRSLRAKAYARGRRTIWPEFVKQCAAIIGQVVPRARPDRAAIAKPIMPAPDAVLRLIDGVGMLQHTRGIVPDRRHGYSIDDNARALILMNHWGPHYDDIAVLLASFLQHAWNDNAGRFRNFMSFERRWLEAAGSDDSNGRTIWAIGHTARRASDPRLQDWAMTLFQETAPHLRDIASPRAMAFLVLGADEVLGRDENDLVARELVEVCAARFATLPLLGRADEKEWPWFEPKLTYDNARIPQALFTLYQLTRRADLKIAGQRQLAWLARLHTTAKGHFRAIGSESFAHKGLLRPFDQQPLEAWAIIDACAKAVELELDGNWRELAQRAYAWYAGHNDRGIPIANPSTGSCLDGLMATGTNSNSGAESVLSYSLAYHSLVTMTGGKAGHVEQNDRSRAKGVVN